MGILMALLSGIFMSVQGVWNTGVTEKSSIWVAAGFVQLTAFAVCAAAWLVTGHPSISGLWTVEPKYMLLGGVLGAFITYTVIESMSALGPAQAVMIIVVSQLAAAYLIQLFGLFGVEKAEFQLRKLIGMLLAVAGIILFKWEQGNP